MAVNHVAFLHCAPLLPQQINHHKLATNRAQRRRQPTRAQAEQRFEKYQISQIWQPLIGLPRFTPPIHTRILLTPSTTSANTLSLDLIPANATDAGVLFALLTGRCVPAIARMRRSSERRMGAKASWSRLERGHVRVTEASIAAWNDAYVGCGCATGRVGIALIGDNCYDYAERLVAYLRQVDADARV